MIAALAFGLVLQTRPSISLKQVWSAGPDFTDESGRARRYGVLTRYKNSRTFRFLAAREQTRNSDPVEEDLYEFDTIDGNLKRLITLTDIGKPASVSSEFTTFSLSLDGEVLRAHWDRAVKTVGACGAVYAEPRLLFVEGLNHYLAPKDEDAAAATVLFPTSIHISSIGDAKILHDGTNARLLAVAGEVQSYQPRSWTLDRVLVARGDLSARNASFLDVQIVGDPETGSFAICNGTRSSSRSAFFNANMGKIEIDPSDFPYDSSTNGFLVATGKPAYLSCLDPQTGNELWHRRDLVLGDGAAYFMGRYVISFGRHAFDVQGHVIVLLEVLDPASGKTLYQRGLPKDFELWLKSGLPDTVVMRDGADKLYGYRLVGG